MDGPVESAVSIAPSIAEARPLVGLRTRALASDPVRRVLGLIVVAVVAASCSWTVPGGNPQRTGTNSFAPGVMRATLDALTTAWTSADHGALFEQVIVRGDHAVRDILVLAPAGSGLSRGSRSMSSPARSTAAAPPSPCRSVPGPRWSPASRWTATGCSC